MSSSGRTTRTAANSLSTFRREDHLLVGDGRVGLSGDRALPVQPQGGRLGDGRLAGCGVGRSGVSLGRHPPPPAGGGVHSDRGCQYTSADYQAVLASAEMMVSFSRKGTAGTKPDGVVPRQPEQGGVAPLGVRRRGGGRASRVQLHRSVLKPRAVALVAGLRQSGNVQILTTRPHRQQIMGMSSNSQIPRLEFALRCNSEKLPRLVANCSGKV
jgi:hypothetical protein